MTWLSAKTVERHQIIQDPGVLVQEIRRRLNGDGLADNWGLKAHGGKVKGSAVLLLLTQCRTQGVGPQETCLLLNKRSQEVLQPGDLCCPGGGVEWLDKVVAPVLHWPLSPLRKWPSWKKWKSKHPGKAQGLALCLTTALRESWEEMKLNPFKVKFMGPLPVQQLVMFQRQIYPLAGWVPADQQLVPNWEVERIVYIPLQRMFDPQHYGRYRLSYKSRDGKDHLGDDFPCFIHRSASGNEILWGATFRIAMDFLRLSFGFELPDLRNAAVINRQLDETYYEGSSNQQHLANRNE